MKCLPKASWPFVTLAVGAALFSAGCSSEMTVIVPQPPGHAQIVAKDVQGTASGALCIGYPPLSLIPIGLNERMENAYSDALSKAPGATALKNVTVEEDWYWIVVGTLRYVTITGDAVK